MNNIRFFNNTKFEDDFVLDFVKPHMLMLDTNKIESIEVCEGNKNNFKITVFGIECILLETHSDTNHVVQGKIRWFNESSGEGMIRLDSGKSIQFYSCNVKGANNFYPELVSNVHFEKGQSVKAVLQGDLHLINAIGLTDVEAV